MKKVICILLIFIIVITLGKSITKTILNSVKDEGNYMVNDTLSSNIQLRKPLLKYDGIYKSNVTGFDNKETQSWTLDKSKDNMGVYGDDRLLHF